MTYRVQTTGANSEVALRINSAACCGDFNISLPARRSKDVVEFARVPRIRKCSVEVGLSYDAHGHNLISLDIAVAGFSRINRLRVSFVMLGKISVPAVAC